MKTIILNNFEIAGSKLTIMAGPCAIESKEICFQVCEELKKITAELDINYIFKASFDKANRSSINSYRGLGIEKGLEILSQVKKNFMFPL